MSKVRKTWPVNIFFMLVAYGCLSIPQVKAAQIRLSEPLTQAQGAWSQEPVVELPSQKSIVGPDNSCGDDLPASGTGVKEPSEASPGQQLSLEPKHLIASATLANQDLRSSNASQSLIAQAVEPEFDCSVGGGPPVGGAIPAAGFPFAALAGLAPAAAIPFLVDGGDDSPPTTTPPSTTPPSTTPPPPTPPPSTPPVPEASESATAGLFAGLGVAAILLRRKTRPIE